jgi:hypothetical protein
MNPPAHTIEDVERALEEGRLGDIEFMPPYLGTLPKLPRLRPNGGLAVDYPDEVSRHAIAWARVKRALRDAERPNPYRVHREIKPDPEFLARNVTFLMLRDLGVKCGFQWPVTKNIRHNFVVFPTHDGQSSQFAREHIYRPDRNIWSLAIYSVRDIREDLSVPEYQLWRNFRDGQSASDPWRAHAAVLSTLVIPDRPHNCLCLNGWVNVEDLALGKTVERDYDHIDARGRAKVGKLACRQVPLARLRPMIELLPLLAGWDLNRAKAEKRIDVSGGAFGGKA